MADQDMDQTLRETWAKVRPGAEGDFTPQEPEEPALRADEPADPAPAEITSEEPINSTDPQEPVDPEEPVDSDPEPVPEPAAFRPSWKKAALAEWDKLPEIVRNEVKRREDDFHKGIEEYKQRASAAQDWERTVQPYMATIQSFGVSPQVAAQELFKADHLLRYSAPAQKVQMLLKIAGDYGVDIGTLANGIQQVAGEKIWQQQNPVDPHVQQLQAEIQQLKHQKMQEQQQARAQEASTIDAEIAAFAADPDHEHFGLLQNDMAVLLQGGLAKSLPEAYEMAMRQNPQTYQIWLAQQQQEWDAQRKAKVAKAKQAGANVVRPNGRASVPAANPARTMEEDIEATARSLGLIN